MGSCRTLGEAAFVKVGNQGLVFMTMGRFYVDLINRGRNWADARSTKWTVPLAKDVEMPTLARFRNISDPASMVYLDPNNLQSEFGPRVRYQSITVEKIPFGFVTKGKVLEVIPWPDKYRGNAAFHDFNSKPLSTTVGATRPDIFLGSGGSKPKDRGQ